MKNTIENMKNSDEATMVGIAERGEYRMRGGRRERLNEEEMPLLFLIPLV